MRLSDFIMDYMEEILGEWESFASSIVPPALTMDRIALRNHAKLMLQAIALDLNQHQSADQQKTKSLGQGRLLDAESSAETHAAARLLSGFSVEQLYSEYRALRASVLRLWARDEMRGVTTDALDITRFNEAVDQAVAESITRYSELVSTSQHLFLAILGHDLKNPLSTTLMASRFILENSDFDQHVIAANRIQNSTIRMSKLVNDLLDYTRTHLGSSLPIDVKLMSLEDACRDALSELEMAHPERKFDLIAQGNCEGEWDGHRLAQVLSNLIGNAVQYGDIAEPILLRLHARMDDVVLSVTNKGKVIPSERIGTLFDPLVRLADDRSNCRNSLGIGLYIAREIVRAHGGTITASSTAENGTTFTIVLPRNAQVSP